MWKKEISAADGNPTKSQKEENHLEEGEIQKTVMEMQLTKPTDNNELTPSNKHEHGWERDAMASMLTAVSLRIPAQPWFTYRQNKSTPHCLHPSTLSFYRVT